MTVKTKLITTFIVFDLVLMLIITIGTYFIIDNRASFIEDQYVHRSVDQLQEMTRTDLRNLSKVNKDYARWDDTYNFIKNKNTLYKETNLTQTNFGETLNLDFVYLIDIDKKLVAAWHNQFSNMGELPTETASLSALLTVYDQLKSQNIHEPEGIVQLPTGLAYVSVKEVVPSNGNGPSDGYMVIGINIDKEKIQEISNQLKLPVKLEQTNDIKQTESYSFVKTKDSVLGKMYIRDVLGNYRGYFSITILRDIYNSARLAFRYFVFLMLILFIASFVFVMRFSETVFGSILHRISYLNMKARSAVLEDYEAPLNYCSWESSQDELGELARSMEKMRVAAYESTSTLKKTVEEKTKELSIRLEKEEKTAQAVVYLLDREKQHSKDLIEKETALTKLTETLKMKNEDLREANQVKNEFVNIATHQIKNPLAALRGFVGMIHQGIYGKVPSKLTEPMNQISICTEQIVSLVEDMLKISRSEEKNYPMTIGKVNLTEVISGAQKSVESQLVQKKLKLKYELPKESPLVLADTEKIRDIVMNLVSNAIKYTEKGKITISHEVTGNVLVTHVTDTGYGIPINEQKHLFTRFYRTRNAIARDIPGTGLGLYIVKEYIVRMNGKVWVESDEGKGSTFSFSLPKA